MSDTLIFEVATDQAANDCRRQMQRMGSLNVRVLNCGQDRIVLSRDPSGPQGQFQWHVSVSCRRKTVSVDTVKMYAAALLPHVSEWGTVLARKTAMHIWSKC